MSESNDDRSEAHDPDNGFGSETGDDSHPAAEDLAAFAEGRLDSGARLEVIEHLRDCPQCQHGLSQTLHTLLALQDSPDESWSATEHPSDQDWAALAEGRLDDDARGVLIDHLQGCIRCHMIFTETLTLDEDPN